MLLPDAVPLLQEQMSFLLVLAVLRHQQNFRERHPFLNSRLDPKDSRKKECTMYAIMLTAVDKDTAVRRKHPEDITLISPLCQAEDRDRTEAIREACRLCASPLSVSAARGTPAD
jgi:hypothetical protein